MPGGIPCPNCHAHCPIEPSLAGRMVNCAECGYAFRAPDAGGMHLPAGMAAEGALWRLRFRTGREFGPVTAELVREWIRERRADDGCLVSKDGGRQWIPLGEAFPPGEARTSDPASDTDAVALPPVDAIPASGILDRLPPAIGAGTRVQRDHESAILRLTKECRRTGGLITLKTSRLIRFGQLRNAYALPSANVTLLEPDYATVVAFGSPSGGEFYCIVPWSIFGRLPHEFFSILPGSMAAPVALRREHEDHAGDGVWIGVAGNSDDFVSVAGRRVQEELTSGIEWQWLSRRRDYTMTLVWGLQAFPIGREKYAHLIQSAARRQAGAEFGLQWYLERQSAFYRFNRRLGVPGDGAPHVLFSSCAGRILCHTANLAAPFHPAAEL